jgi:parallel beta-helix repeat protein
MPRYGISLTSLGSDNYSHNNIIEFNEVVETNLETADTGAIETLGRDRQLSGNIIRFNFIRNVVGMGTTPDGQIHSPYYTWGIYLDDYSSGTIIYGNIVVSTVLGAICLHGGKSNIIENNIFVNGLENQIRLQPRDEFMKDNIFRRNIVTFNNPSATVWFNYAKTWQQGNLAQCDFNIYWQTCGLDLAKTERFLSPEGDFAKWQKSGSIIYFTEAGKLSAET